MTRGGKREGAGRKEKEPEDKRHAFNCRIKLETLNWIKTEREKTGQSAGEIIDNLVLEKQQ